MPKFVDKAVTKQFNIENSNEFLNSISGFQNINMKSYKQDSQSLDRPINLQPKKSELYEINKSNIRENNSLSLYNKNGFKSSNINTKLNKKAFNLSSKKTTNLNKYSGVSPETNTYSLYAQLFSKSRNDNQTMIKEKKFNKTYSNLKSKTFKGNKTNNRLNNKNISLVTFKGKTNDLKKSLNVYSSTNKELNKPVYLSQLEKSKMSCDENTENSFDDKKFLENLFVQIQSISEENDSLMLRYSEMAKECIKLFGETKNSIKQFNQTTKEMEKLKVTTNMQLSHNKMKINLV